MRCQFIAAITLLGVLMVSANQSPDTAKVAATNGLSTRIFLEGGRQSIDARQHITFEMTDAATNREVVLFFPEDLKFLCRMELLDDTGKVVTKTAQGQSMGSEFQKVTNSLKYVKSNGMRASFQNDGTEIVTRRVKVDRAALSNMLPAPDELFEISKPGSYKLRSEIQCLMIATNSEVVVIRFPATEVSVVKK